MQTAKRLDGIGEYYFSQKLREIEELNKQGSPVINLGIGSPDLPPHPEVIAELQDASARPDTHAYQSYKGSPVLRKAIASWYKEWYNADIDPEKEVLPLIGSKEGIMHVCMTYLNEGDSAWVPNPGYPTYRSAARLAGANVIEYPLTAENNWFPDFEEMERLLLSGKVRKGGLLFLNYPQMPTGQLPTGELFEQVLAFAKKFGILVVHDNPYSFILNDKPMSLFSVPGARENAIELNSLSKSQNMAGWRVGMLIGARERVEEVLRFKSNMDSGMFLPLQLAAAKALLLPASWYQQLNEIYRKRRAFVYELLDLLGASYNREQAGLFVWAAIGSSYESGYELSDALLRQARVFITPGGIFGDAGNKYIRVSLCSKEEKLKESIARVKQFLKK